MSKIKINNSGITLVELLISIVIGTIVISAVVILLNQGINGYSKQTITAQLQNDAAITLNQMTDAIMEATCINIFNETSGTGNTPNFITKLTKDGVDGNAYSYDSNNKILYVGTTISITDYKQSGILCKNVEKFNIQIINSSVKVENKTEVVGGLSVDKARIIGINNPVQIKVSLTLKYNGISREVTRVTALRNELKNLDTDLTIQGINISEFQLKSALDAYFTD